MKVSVAIITKNEAGNLPHCLKSVAFSDDVVVVDSGSVDRTVAIAEEFGCRVFTEEWKGYGPQKNSAVEKCRHTWVLLLDADEQVPVETQASIRKIMERPAAAAYSFRRKNYFHGRWIKYSGNWPDRTIRLVDRTKGVFESVIHEKWVTTGSLQELDACLLHYSFSCYSDLLKTLNRYSTIASEELYASGRRANPLSPLYHGAGMFLKMYFIERGFTGGLDGLVISLTKAGGSFFKYAKLLELQRKNTG